MKKMKSRVLYHGGSLPVPSHLQKGVIELAGGAFHFRAKGKAPRYDISVSVPAADIRRALVEERKYYSSVGYMLILGYTDENGEEQELELEIRSFVRRGRAQALARHWADTLSAPQNPESTPAEQRSREAPRGR